MKNPRLIPEPMPLELLDFFQYIRQLISDGHLLLNYFGSSEKLIYALFGKDGELKLLSAPFPISESYDSLTPEFPAFNMYERLLYEEFWHLA